MLKFDKVSFFYENEALFRDFCIEISENKTLGIKPSVFYHLIVCSISNLVYRKHLDEGFDERLHQIVLKLDPRLLDLYRAHQDRT